MPVEPAVGRADRIPDERINLIGVQIEFQQRRMRQIAFGNQQRSVAFDVRLLCFGNQQDRDPFDDPVAMLVGANEGVALTMQRLLVARAHNDFQKFGSA